VDLAVAEFTNKKRT